VSNLPQLDWTATAAGITEPWRLFVGDAGASIGVDHFGASAAYQKIYQEFGITAERVAAAARDSLARVRP
jgi:transketolase